MHHVTGDCFNVINPGPLAMSLNSLLSNFNLSDCENNLEAQNMNELCLFSLAAPDWKQKGNVTPSTDQAEILETGRVTLFFNPQARCYFIFWRPKCDYSQQRYSEAYQKEVMVWIPHLDFCEALMYWCIFNIYQFQFLLNAWLSLHCKCNKKEIQV